MLCAAPLPSDHPNPQVWRAPDQGSTGSSPLPGLHLEGRRHRCYAQQPDMYSLQPSLWGYFLWNLLSNHVALTSRSATHEASVKEYPFHRTMYCSLPLVVSLTPGLFRTGASLQDPVAGEGARYWSLPQVSKGCCETMGASSPASVEVPVPRSWD